MCCWASHARQRAASAPCWRQRVSTLLMLKRCVSLLLFTRAGPPPHAPHPCQRVTPGRSPAYRLCELRVRPD